MLNSCPLLQEVAIMPGPTSPRIPQLSDDTRAELLRLTRSPSLPAGRARPARIVLRAADGTPLRHIGPLVGVSRTAVRDWLDRFRTQGLAGLQDVPRPGRPRRCSPDVELQAVDLACTVPDQAGASLSQSDSTERARRRVADGVVPAISPATVSRLRRRHRLRPWRCHLWLHPRRPRDAGFLAQVRAIADLSTRALLPTEVVLSIDDITQLHPRPRAVPTRPAGPDRPLQREHEYRRGGALNFFAAFDTRTGAVAG